MLDFSSAPVKVSAPVAFESITAGGDDTCGLAPDGSGYCRGLNDIAQLGNGTRGGLEANPTPQRIVGGLRFATLATAGDHACGMATDGIVYCWGAVGRGQLGNGRVQQPNAAIIEVESSPVPVVAPPSLAVPPPK